MSVSAQGSSESGPRRRASQAEAVAIVTKALEAAKRARSLGVDVRPARPLIKECQRAFMAGDYDRAILLAEELNRRFGGSVEPPRA